MVRALSKEYANEHISPKATISKTRSSIEKVKREFDPARVNNTQISESFLKLVSINNKALTTKQMMYTETAKLPRDTRESFRLHETVLLNIDGWYYFKRMVVRLDVEAVESTASALLIATIL